MSNELISILVLVAVFLVATTTGINMGVLGIVAAFGTARSTGWCRARYEPWAAARPRSRG
jgi:dicarboxylate carrier protein MatC